MKKAILACTLLLPFSAAALVAPEKYMADSSCPKNAPFKHAQWNNYEGRDGGYYTPYGECISCHTTKAFMLVNAEECNLCPNRTVDNKDIFGGWISTDYCRLKECPPDKPFYEENWNWSGCKSCQDEPKHIKKDECAQCPNMRWVEGVGCAPDKSDRLYYDVTALSQNGVEDHLVGGSPPYVIRCEDIRKRSEFEKAVKTSPEECAHCPNTDMKDGWCYFK